MNLTWKEVESILINAGIGMLMYLALLAAAHPLKKRIRVPLTFSFHLFAVVSGLLAAWYVHLGRGGEDLPWTMAMRQFLIGAWAVLFALQANKFVTRLVWEFVFEERRHLRVPRLLRDLVGLLIVLVAVLSVAKFVYGQELGTLITASGVVAIVLGLALQNLLGDVVAGIALNLEKPFDVGDWVQVASTDAEVIEINWRATRLRTKDNNYLIIPNGQITKESITNFNFPSRLHGIKAYIGVEYNAAPNDVKLVLRRAVLRTPGVVSQEPRIRVKSFGDSAINYEVKFWIEEHHIAEDILSDVMTNFWYALRRAKMEIPYPIHDVYVHQPTSDNTDEQRRRTEATRALRTTALFESLTDEQIAELVAHGRLLRFGRGETIICKGEAGESMFLILTGRATVILTRDEKSEKMTAALHAGESFGEMSLLTGAPRGATVVAETDIRLLEITKTAFSPLLQKNPAVAESVSRLAADRQMANEGFFKRQEAPSEVAATRARYAVNILHNIREFFSV